MTPSKNTQKLTKDESPAASKATKEFVAKARAFHKTRRNPSSALKRWPIAVLRKFLRTFRQLLVKFNEYIVRHLIMKKLYSETNSSLAFSKMFLHKIYIWKRIVILIIFLTLSFIVISRIRDGPKVLYNKWKSERYVGNTYVTIKSNISKNHTIDYLIPFLAQIIYDKQAVVRICDELEIESCSDVAR